MREDGKEAQVVSQRGGRQAAFNARFALSVFKRLRGLLGRDRSWLGRNGVLVLAPCSSIHTFGMNMAIDVAFADAHGVVLKAQEHVGPCRVLSCPGAVMALERFSGDDSVPTQDDPGWLQVGQRVLICPSAAR